MRLPQFIPWLISLGFVPLLGQNTYYLVDFMKVVSSNQEEYLSVERDLWRPIHSQRLEDREIVGWYLYQVRFPTGSETKYNFVSVTVFDDFQKLSSPLSDFERIVRHVHPGMVINDLEDRTNESRILVRSELFQSINELANDSPKPAGCLMVDFMDVKQGEEFNYRQMEDEIWKPVHQRRKDENLILGWMLIELLYPRGTIHPYDFATVTQFEGFEKTIDSWPDGLFEEVHNGENINELNSRTVLSRDLIDSEIWILLTSVEASERR